MIDITKIPGQSKFWHAVNSAVAHNSTIDTVLYSAGTGGGKSYVGAVVSWWFAASHYAGCRGVFLAPTYRLAEQVMLRVWTKVGQACNMLEGRDYVVKKGPYRIEMSNGTVIDILTAEHPERVVGTEYAFAWVDEPGSMREDVWVRLAGRMRVAGTKPVIILTGTPEGMNWVYREVYQSPAALTVFGSTRDNPYLPSAYMDRLEAAYDAKHREAWIEGQFVDLEGSPVYYGFDSGRHVTSGCMPIRPNSPLLLGVDFNISPLVWVLAQDVDGQLVVPDDGVICIKNNASTSVACDMVMDRLARAGLPPDVTIEVYGDASGAHRDTRSGSSDYDILRAAIPASIMHIPRANPSVRSRVNAVNSLCISGGLAIAEKGNSALIDDFQHVCWRDTGGVELDKRQGDRTHATDAIGYVVARRYPIDLKKPYYRSG